MTQKSKKLYGDRWALVKMSGEVARDPIGHRRAIYASRRLAKEMTEAQWAVGLKVRDLRARA